MSNVVIEIKADDVMPWGKYVGLPLRSVYKKDIVYYNYICNKTENYNISNTTKKIVELDLPKEEYSKISYSKTKGNKKELKFNDKITGGPFSGSTLGEIYLKNKTYYRYLCEGNNYYISKKTFDFLTLGTEIAEKVVAELKKTNEESEIFNETKEKITKNTKDKLAKEVELSTKSKKTTNITSKAKKIEIDDQILKPSKKVREQYDKIIENEIDSIWNNLDPEKELKNYIGGRVTGKFSPVLNMKISRNLKNDKYNLQKSLEEIYGPGATFHKDQDRAIAAVLEGKKTLVVQSTGWGKSLVYFLSIKKLREMGKGPAIIISPLLALMRNQIESETVKKTKLNIREINSENEKEWNDIYFQIKENKVDAIMIAPEKLNNDKFLSEIKNVMPFISLFVVDEAHCISDWGHDFRVSFRRIVKFVREFSPQTAILATTATANDRVVRDIKYQLGNDLEVLRGEMNRKNFAIDILRFGNDYGKLSWLQRNLPKLTKTGSGIIYCLTVKDCKKVALFLQEKGLNAKAYYAKLDADEKIEIEKEFQDDKIDVLVATIAFGMGVDKKNIAFIVHYQQPAGVIAYYQQIGRAGRNVDLVPEAKTIMLVGDNDNDTNIYFITHAFPTAENLTKAIDFVSENPECSRQDLIEEFNWKQDKADKILEYLLVDGYLYRKKSRYYRTNREWTCDMKRSRIVSGFRWKELRDFNRFIDSNECYMKQIRNALDDITTETCGKCSICIGRHFFD